MAGSSAPQRLPLLFHPQLRAQEHRWTPLVAASQGQGIQADADSGPSSPGRTLRCLFRLRGGDSAPPGHPGLFLTVLEAQAAHPSGLALPSAHDLTLCNLLLLLFWGFLSCSLSLAFADGN